MLFAYLDEFDHIGPYLSRADQHYHDSPIFGLAGIVLPYTEVRGFANRFLNQIKRKQGFLFYVGIEKRREV